jgi:hypothetical protein
MYKIGESIKESQTLDLLNRGIEAAGDAANQHMGFVTKHIEDGDPASALKSLEVAKRCLEDLQIMSEFDTLQDGWVEKLNELELHHGSYWSTGE